MPHACNLSSLAIPYLSSPASSLYLALPRDQRLCLPHRQTWVQRCTLDLSSPRCWDNGVARQCCAVQFTCYRLPRRCRQARHPQTCALLCCAAPHHALYARGSGRAALPGTARITCHLAYIHIHATSSPFLLASPASFCIPNLSLLFCLGATLHSLHCIHFPPPTFSSPLGVLLYFVRV